MSAHSTDYKDAIDHLPPGAVLVLHDVSWEDYERLLCDLTDRPGLRVAYDEGKLQIVSPLQEHEKCNRFIARLIDAIGDELDLELEALGSTTWKRKRDRKGAEPDTCYYVANARRIIGKDDIDLNVDPPPDLVVEVDATNDSLDKFKIYAAFGIPELWRYNVRKNQLVMYELRGSVYAEISTSRSFPILTAKNLAVYIGQSKTDGQKTALAAFRTWLRKKS